MCTNCRCFRMDVFASKRSRGGRGTRSTAGISPGGTMVIPGRQGNSITASMADRVVQVAHDQMAQVMAVARHNPLVKAVVEKILTDVADCRFTLRLKYGDDFVQLPESEQRLVETKWKSFMRDMLWHIQVVGFVVVAPDKSTMTPRVIPLDGVRVLFREGTATPRTYWAEDPGTGRRIESRLFVKYHPDSSGRLTSPASTVFAHAQRYERVLANQDEADYQRTHPVWAIEHEKNGAGRQDPLENDEFFEGEVMERYAQFHANVRRQEMVDFEDLQGVAVRNYHRTLERAERLGAGAPLPSGVHQAPYLNNFFLPMNQRLATAPRPDMNPHFTAELELLESKVLQAFRVPPMVMETSHAIRYASQPEVAMKQWGATVRGIQRDVATMMEDTYMYVAAPVFQAYAEAIIGGKVQSERTAALRQLLDSERGGGERKRTRREEKEEADEGLPLRAILWTQQSEAEAESAAHASPSGDDDDVAGEKRKQATRKQEPRDAEGEDEADREGAKPPEKNADGDLQLPETVGSLRRAQQVLSVTNPQVMLYIQAKFSVVAEFHCHPTATLDDVTRLYEMGLISRDTLAEQAAELVGMSPELFLIGQDVQEEDARRRKKIQDITEPPEEKKPAGAGSSAAKRK